MICIGSSAAAAKYRFLWLGILYTCRINHRLLAYIPVITLVYNNADYYFDTIQHTRARGHVMYYTTIETFFCILIFDFLEINIRCVRHASADRYLRKTLRKTSTSQQRTYTNMRVCVCVCVFVGTRMCM